MIEEYRTDKGMIRIGAVPGERAPLAERLLGRVGRRVLTEGHALLAYVLPYGSPVRMEADRGYRDFSTSGYVTLDEKPITLFGRRDTGNTHSI